MKKKYKWVLIFRKFKKEDNSVSIYFKIINLMYKINKYKCQYWYNLKKKIIQLVYTLK
jgi:hypothetical protein